MIAEYAINEMWNIVIIGTCHYPDDSFWYELCGKYAGLYVVAEANLESHGMGFGETTLAKVDTYKKAHLNVINGMYNVTSTAGSVIPLVNGK